MLPGALIERCWNLVVYVQLHRFEYYITILVYDISEPINKVTTSVYFAATFVQQVRAAGGPDDDEIAEIIDFKVTHNVYELILSEFSSIFVLLDIEDAFFVHLLLEIILTLITTHIINDLAYDCFCIR